MITVLILHILNFNVLKSVWKNRIVSIETIQVSNDNMYEQLCLQLCMAVTVKLGFWRIG